MNKFNIRVYGLLLNDKGEVLLSDEEIDHFKFSKFPGGGLEFGEGLTDALKREFIEECNLDIAVIEHFYTTDFFVKSLFSDEQLISVYYLVKPNRDFNLKLADKVFDFEDQNMTCKQCFRMVNIKQIEENDLTFPVDKHVLNLLKQYFNE